MAVGPTHPEKSEFLLGFMCFPAPLQSHGHTAGDSSTGGSSTGEDAARCVGRFEALRQLQHPNLARYLDILIGRDHLLFVITEHASRTLADALRACPFGLPEELALRAATQVVGGLCFLNAQGLVHGHLEPQAVIIDEDDGLKLTGYGLQHLMRLSRWARCPLRPRGSYLPPELAHAPSVVDGTPAPTGLCCKADVWSLGILIREMLNGPWHAEADGVNADEGAVMEASVRLETARALRHFNNTASEQHGALSASAVLSNGSIFCIEGMDSSVPPLRSGFAPGEIVLRHLEESYRTWLSGRACSRGSQEMCELWNSCLTVRPALRPSPADLASHPVLSGAGDSIPLSTGKLQWTSCPALRSQRIVPPVLPKELREEGAEAESPLEHLRCHGIEVEDLFYWWSLAGGDVFAALAERRLLRPVPPVFRLPLYVRDGDSGDAGNAGEATGSVAAFLDACAEAEGQPQPPLGQLRGLWGPQGVLRPHIVGADLRKLHSAVVAAEKIGLAAAASIRPRSLYERQHHFTYQWLRVRQFQRLLLTMPKSRPEVFREAAEDVPPLLRSKVWAAVIGADSDSDQGCWSLFYERLLAAPVERSSEDERAAYEVHVCHELISNPDGQRRLHRLVRAVLKANPSLARVDGLGALAAPLAVLYPGNEPAAFLLLQRILHGFLWNYYAKESPLHRQQSMHLFAALLRFADPLLERHLQEIGMQPDIYAGMWFPTWFAQLLPLHQLLLLWDAILLRPPQFALFVGVCLLHFFRRALLNMDDVSHVASFLASCAQLVDVAMLVQASLALLEAVPSSVTLPLYPRHSAGDALLSQPGAAGVAAVDPAWTDEVPDSAEPGEQAPDPLAEAREQLVKRAMSQWGQCDWWRQRPASKPTPPVITVDDLLSFRSRCFVLDVRPFDEYAEGHFQASAHVRDPRDGDLKSIVSSEVLSMGGTPKPSEAAAEHPEESADSTAQSLAAAPWLFAFGPEQEAPTLRVRLVVVVGGTEDMGTAFAERLVEAGVRHVVCMLGGAAALRADALSYMTSGAE